MVKKIIDDFNQMYKIAYNANVTTTFQWRFENRYKFEISNNVATFKQAGKTYKLQIVMVVNALTFIKIHVVCR